MKTIISMKPSFGLIVKFLTYEKNAVQCHIFNISFFQKLPVNNHFGVVFLKILIIFFKKHQNGLWCETYGTINEFFR